jgi:acyl-CoA reductase-like NAD-dependent aldehyde dehydrogenase
MEAGSVGINCTSPTYAADQPFGGYKVFASWLLDKYKSLIVPRAPDKDVKVTATAWNTILNIRVL